MKQDKARLRLNVGNVKSFLGLEKKGGENTPHPHKIPRAFFLLGFLMGGYIVGGNNFS